MASLEGQINIELVCDTSGVRQANIHSARPVQASRVFEGVAVKEALQRLPQIYSLCGTAQSATALSACENALGINPSTAQRQAREMLVWMESAREHLLRILLDWPAFAGEEVKQKNLPGLMQLLPELSHALYGNAAPFSLESVPDVDSDAAQQVIEKLRDIIDDTIGASLPNGQDSFKDWLIHGETLPARLLYRLRTLKWDRLGTSDSRFLPPLESHTLHTRLTAEDADAFIAAPVWMEYPCENTPLHRQRLQPFIKELLANEGNGLTTRLMSRLTELMLVPDLLRLSLKRLGATLPITSSSKGESGIGLAQVEAARGRLIHRVEIEDNIVRRYQILAPTEWNFHPQGIAVKGLRTLTGSDEETLKQQATLWINAIDPCVGINLQVRHDA